jgi:hypothetical protein
VEAGSPSRYLPVTAVLDVVPQYAAYVMSLHRSVPANEQMSSWFRIREQNGIGSINAKLELRAGHCSGLS